jgi:transposase
MRRDVIQHGMISEAQKVRLRRGDRAILEARVRASTTEQRHVLRARIVLAAAQGLATREIGRALNTTPTTVSHWRIRYAEEGLDGLEDRDRGGPPALYGEKTDAAIRKVIDQAPPKGFARWNGPLIAEALGNVDVQYVWRSLRKQKIDLGGRKSWCESNDPDFATKAADVVGLYMAPPKNAIVLCIDEKPSIQALERDQGYLKLPNGRALTGHSHDYKRHGTTTLFAAFEVATGKVKAAHKKRRRRKEFLDFMDEIVAAYPNRRLEVILDNLNTHKKNDDWLKRHPRVTFHYTPTRASWLNQVECWFSILQGQSLAGASFTSVEQVKAHIDAFIETYNEDAEPFVWTKSKVHQRRVKGRRLRNL